MSGAGTATGTRYEPRRINGNGPDARLAPGRKVLIGCGLVDIGGHGKLRVPTLGLALPQQTPKTAHRGGVTAH